MRTGFAAGVTLADGTALSPGRGDRPLPGRLHRAGSAAGRACTTRSSGCSACTVPGVNALHRDAIGGLALDAEPCPGPVAGAV
ncbi:MAG: hypothetical protein ACLVJH_09580 [Faecalibacterium prausnitzii]